MTHTQNQKSNSKPASNHAPFIAAKGQGNFFSSTSGSEASFFSPRPEKINKKRRRKEKRRRKKRKKNMDNLVGLPSKEQANGKYQNRPQDVAQSKVFFRQQKQEEGNWWSGWFGAKEKEEDSFIPMTENQYYTLLEPNSIDQQFGDIVFAEGQEYDFIEGHTYADRIAYRRNLITSIIKQMYCSNKELYYDSLAEMASDIRKRAVTSLSMRVTQGKASNDRPTGYPKHCKGAQVNELAQPYWNVSGDNLFYDYHFELTNKGYANPYEALEHLLFIHQKEDCLRSLMHCDHMVSAIHYKAMADAMGAAKFNEQVRNRQISLTLTPTAFYDNNTYDKSDKNADTNNKSLQRVSLNSIHDLIIGDHVVFYNHDAYDALSLYLGGASWRLENAIVTDLKNGDLRFQGHGFFSPKTLPEFVAAMRTQFNKILRQARKAFEGGSERDFKKEYRKIKYKSFGRKKHKAQIQYQVGSVGGCPVSENSYWPLYQDATDKDYPNPLSLACNNKIVVYRPIESIKQSL